MCILADLILTERMFAMLRFEEKKNKDGSNDNVSKKQKDPPIIPIIGALGVCMIGLIAAGAVNCFLDLKDLHSERYELSSQIDAIQIPEWEDPISSDDDSDAVKRLMDEVSEKGDDVAYCQNSFLSLFMDDEMEGYMFSDKMESAKEHMRPHFMEGSASWYMPGDSAEPKGLSWRFVGGYESPENVPSLWLLEDSDGKLAAYVTAEYDRSAGKFFGASVIMTTYGRTLCSDSDMPDDYESVVPEEPDAQASETEEGGGDDASVNP